MENLSKLKIEQLNKQPVIESFMTMSDDGKWLIHKTVITDIKPVTYLDKVKENLENKKKKNS